MPEHRRGKGEGGQRLRQELLGVVDEGRVDRGQQRRPDPDRRTREPPAQQVDDQHHQAAEERHHGARELLVHAPGQVVDARIEDRRSRRPVRRVAHLRSAVAAGLVERLRRSRRTTWSRCPGRRRSSRRRGPRSGSALPPGAGRSRAPRRAPVPRGSPGRRAARAACAPAAARGWRSSRGASVAAC